MRLVRVASRSALTAALVALTIVIGACSSSSSKASAPEPPAGQKIQWPAPPDPMARTVAAGLVPETSEHLEFHVHAHLDVFQDGKQVVVPGGIGIDTTNPAVHSGEIGGYPAYGGINPPCATPCISPLHTHDATGVIHTESSTRRTGTFLCGEMARNQSGRLSGSMWRNSNGMFFSRRTIADRCTHGHVLKLTRRYFAMMSSAGWRRSAGDSGNSTPPLRGIQAHCDSKARNG